MGFLVLLAFVVLALRRYWPKLVALLSALSLRLRFRVRVEPGHRPFRRKKASPRSDQRFRRKPAWVADKVLRLKAQHPDFGCRKIAHEFNRLYAVDRHVTVGKTYVDDLIRSCRYLVQILRREIKNRHARYVPKNLVWGLDLTAVVEPGGAIHYILGLVEHNTRACLGVTALTNKSTRTILAVLREAIGEAGCRPKNIRTDNEAIFGPKFTEGLRRLGIRHQKTEKHCPWQNGRVERFFGTLQERMNHIIVDSFEQLQLGLVDFRFWYNHVRPHQALAGWTPAEAWVGRGALNAKRISVEPYSAWGGLLQGELIRV